MWRISPSCGSEWGGSEHHEPGGLFVIARVWHGHTKPEHADAYESILKPELLPGISKAKGYRGSYLLRRNVGPEVEFITIMLWDSIDDIKAVAGEDYETSIIPEERRQYLSKHEPKAAHYEIVATNGLFQFLAS
jgi:heme-degrading monooxygenase HmoA